MVVPWLQEAGRANNDEDDDDKPREDDKGANVIQPIHIVVVAHGIFLSEFLRVLMLSQRPNVEPPRMAGFANTGWTRLQVSVVDPSSFGDDGVGDLIDVDGAELRRKRQRSDNANLFAVLPDETPASTSLSRTSTTTTTWPVPPTRFPSRFNPVLIPFNYPPTTASTTNTSSASSSTSSPSTPYSGPSPNGQTTDEEEEQLVGQDPEIPKLSVKVVQLNNSLHLAGLKRQKGGIGSAAYSPEQKKLHAFFGGGGGGGATA